MNDTVVLEVDRAGRAEALIELSLPIKLGIESRDVYVAPIASARVTGGRERLVGGAELVVELLPHGPLLWAGADVQTGLQAATGWLLCAGAFLGWGPLFVTARPSIDSSGRSDLSVAFTLKAPIPLGH